MASAESNSFYEFTLTGVGHIYNFILSQIKKHNSIFPPGTKVKRSGNDLKFGATFREVLPEVKSAMTRFIYKLGKDYRIEDLDKSLIRFVKTNLKFNEPKKKFLEWIMPFNGEGIVYTITYDTEKNCLFIGAFTYLHRLHPDMFDEAEEFKGQFLTAFEDECSELFMRTKHVVRKNKYNSCFDDIVLVYEDDAAEKPIPEATVCPELQTHDKSTDSTHSNEPEPVVPTREKSPEPEEKKGTKGFVFLKICWVCDKEGAECTC